MLGEDGDDALNDLLGDDGDTDLDALLADDDDNSLDDLLSDAGDADDDLADLLGDDTDTDDDLDALLADDDSDADLADLLGDDDGDLDALLAESDDDQPDDDPAPEEKKVSKPKDGFQPNFGTLDAPALSHEAGARRKFRIAVLGDFSGRANRGALEIGTDLAARKGFKLDFDTLETVVSRFRTTLTLPVGNDGAAMEVELNELDDLHPDELFDNMEVFSELSAIRRSLTSGRNLESAIRQLEGWGAEFADYKVKSSKRGKGGAAPADMKLSDFQSLIGDTTPRAEASDATDIIARIVGPYITASPQKGTEAMVAAVDKALSGLMSAILHHPDFQFLESAWRSIDLLGRRVESGTNLEVVVYDMAAEELAADLAGTENMAETGLFDMLVERPRADESQGPLSAVIGLFTWEETPPHAEILARMARISAYMDAPFISSISTGFMGIKPEDRHPLVQKTWGALREMPEARYLGLATPRFMLRMPYGKKSDPIDRFEYEEFSTKEGVRSFLMANPALLVAVLLAESVSQQGKNIKLGSIMTLDDVPFYYMLDQYGDQVALPCTERLLNVRSSAEVVARGYMPVLSIQGQNVVRLGSFQSVGGGELLGIWSGDSAGELGAGRIQARTSVGIGAATPKAAGGGGKAAAAASAGAGGDDDGDDDDLDLDFGGDDDDGGDLDLDLDFGDDGDDGGDLDDLLAGFGDDDDDGGDDGDMDADLAALLGDL
ncbi:type VI secretion system contractile sheath large subunit [Abyssibius alkaniclasticus]|nr:type VI secretion system contractile sheath large subunit [Abyssibius alkaniclasticus]UPH72785.1 type VI secretion system contractile sheath large subunit [Abyssibius alkaniclasticus]